MTVFDISVYVSFAIIVIIAYLISNLFDTIIMRRAIKMCISKKLTLNGFSIINTGNVAFLSKGDFGRIIWCDFELLYRLGAARYKWYIYKYLYIKKKDCDNEVRITVRITVSFLVIKNIEYSHGLD